MSYSAPEVSFYYHNNQMRNFQNFLYLIYFQDLIEHTEVSLSLTEGNDIFFRLYILYPYSLCNHMLFPYNPSESRQRTKVLLFYFLYCQYLFLNHLLTIFPISSFLYILKQPHFLWNCLIPSFQVSFHIPLQFF